MIANRLLAGIALLAASAHAEAPSPAAPAVDNATLFGARPTVMNARLSPDGSHIAYITPWAGRGSLVIVAAVDHDDQGKPISRGTGSPDRLVGCHWVSNKRLVCQVFGITQSDVGLVPFSRLMAIDVDGSNLKALATRTDEYSRGYQLSDGNVIDWLPDEDGVVLMARSNLPNDHTGSHVGSDKEGLSVDRIDTTTLKATTVEQPKLFATDYITDGRGIVRIYGIDRVAGTGQATGVTTYYYRRKDAREWIRLGDFNYETNEGFNPFAVDRDHNVAYGLMKKDGRTAFYSVTLDGSLTFTQLAARPDVDIDGVKRMGRRGRVVGATFQTDKREAVYFDPEIKALLGALSRALPKQPLVQVVDSSVDERKLLIFAGSDNDPGVYYLFNRDTKELHVVMPARPVLEGRTLAEMKPVRFRATDGAMIPAYLTLPPGKADAKGLPAIVMPHGGPSDRDEWGFDWLPQYYAAQGYAVLQPEFRGSTGYGDAWYQKNGFRSWRTAIGDVVDAGRWLVSEHVADPAKLSIVGWSYGGYAALQSAVVAPDLYKAVVAIAPVTDLAMLKTQYFQWSNERLAEAFIGSGPDIVRDGSPAQNAAKIKAPVLLVHGTIDRNVFYQQSTMMQARLKAAGDKVQLITFEGLDHQLDDSEARARMLRESDAFIRAAIGGAAANAGEVGSPAH